MEKALELYSGAGLPGTTHQRVAGWLYTEISVYLKAKRERCQALAAPFAVFLDGEEAGCVQPDISVVADGSMLDEAGCHGAPDWVVEVVNTQSRGLDYGRKLAAYIEAGVKEYWVVDPDRSVIVCYFLEEPDVPAVYHFGEIVRSRIYEDLVMDSAPLETFRYGKAERAAAGRAGDEGARQAGRLEKNRSEPERQEYDGVEEASAELENQRRPDAVPGYRQSEVRAAEVHPGASFSGAARRLEKTGWEKDGGEQEEASLRLEQETKGTMSVDEVKAYLENHFAELVSSRNKGQLMKAAMAALKGKADTKVLSEAAAKLCRQEN